VRLSTLSSTLPGSVLLGLRSGMLIGIILLLTVAGTFMVMSQADIFLQQVSLDALIIALGSLVDNAIVVTERMLVGVQRGSSVELPASDTVSTSIWSMLGGTLFAIFALAPIWLSPDSTDEFCLSLLQVVGISIILSWLLAITATPEIGSIMIKSSHQLEDPYDKFLFRAYRKFLETCLHFRFVTVIVVLGLFLFSIFVIMNNVSSFVGRGSLRFMLTHSQPDSNNAFSELLVEVRDNGDTQAILHETQRIIDKEMPGV
jgi:multidrug efflux pump subunit AcrB